MMEKVGERLDTTAIKLAEELVQVRAFEYDEALQRLYYSEPERLLPTAISQRDVAFGGIFAAVNRYLQANPQEIMNVGGVDWPSMRAFRNLQRLHAQEFRLVGRQLIMMQNFERFVEQRDSGSIVTASDTVPTDKYARIARFLQTHQETPKDWEGVKPSMYHLLTKYGTVYSSTTDEQDYAMAVVLRETGIGKEASTQYPGLLKALVVAPTDRATYRLGYRHTGTSTIHQEAPNLVFITTKRYRDRLVRDQGGRVVVTDPQFLEESLLSGVMTNTTFDLIVTDGFTHEETSNLLPLIHAQQVGPVVINFAVGEAKSNPKSLVDSSDQKDE